MFFRKNFFTEKSVFDSKEVQNAKDEMCLTTLNSALVYFPQVLEYLSE